MVQNRSILNVADNSGAQKLIVIGIPKFSLKKYAKIGDIVTASVKKAIPTGNVKEHEIVKSVVVRTKKELRRQDGSYIRFSDNAVVIIDAQNNPRGTRIFGPIAREIKEKGFSKIASLAPEIV
jgi:large subunit ribosomal protein L14